MCQALLDLMKPEVDAIVKEEKQAAAEAAAEATAEATMNTAIEKMADYLMKLDSSLTKKKALAEAKKAMA